MGASFCLKCKKRTTCQKICPKLEKELKKVEQGRNSRVSIVNPRAIDNIVYREKENGKRKKAHLLDEADHVFLRPWSANDYKTQAWHKGK